MQLKRAEFHNFKLLENVALEFSTDPSRPADGCTSRKWIGQNVHSVGASLGLLRFPRPAVWCAESAIDIERGSG